MHSKWGFTSHQTTIYRQMAKLRESIKCSSSTSVCTATTSNLTSHIYSLWLNLLTITHPPRQWIYPPSSQTRGTTHDWKYKTYKGQHLRMQEPLSTIWIQYTWNSRKQLLEPTTLSRTYRQEKITSPISFNRRQHVCPCKVYQNNKTLEKTIREIYWTIWLVSSSKISNRTNPPPPLSKWMTNLNLKLWSY